jgi:hypothetical protein
MLEEIQRPFDILQVESRSLIGVILITVKISINLL